jgi:hypothetical protein
VLIILGGILPTTIFENVLAQEDNGTGGEIGGTYGGINGAGGDTEGTIGDESGID